MSAYEIAVPATLLGFTCLSYLYILNERRKLMNARRKRREAQGLTPAE